MEQKTAGMCGAMVVCPLPPAMPSCKQVEVQVEVGRMGRRPQQHA